MITELDNLPSSLIADDAALIKIHCLYFAYKDKKNMVGFFKQTDENGKVTAIISLSGSNVNLWQDGADLHEIKSYLEFIGAENVFTCKKTANSLALKPIKPCFLMKTKQTELGEECKLREDTPRRILEVLKTGLPIKDDDEFLSDITYRLYHSAAGCALSDKGAGIVFKSEVCSIIGGLAVLPEYRRKGGFGSELLSSLKRQSISENFFVCCEEKNIGFYNKNGFAVVGEAGDFEV